MVHLFRRWLGRARDGESWDEVAGWAARNGYRFARSREADGFIIEATQPAGGWRLEWGPPQRHYFNGPELRLRAEVGATGDLQMLVMSRELMGLLEQQVYEESTDGTETRMDDDLPEEMRWLVLYPKVPRAELGTLRERFGALSNFPSAALSWLDKGTVGQLDKSAAWLGAGQPLALVMRRGRLTLRCQLVPATLPALQGALELFAVALAAAQRVGNELNAGRFSVDRPSGWGPPSALPEG